MDIFNTNPFVDLLTVEEQKHRSVWLIWLIGAVQSTTLEVQAVPVNAGWANRKHVSSTEFDLMVTSVSQNQMQVSTGGFVHLHLFCAHLSFQL